METGEQQLTRRSKSYWTGKSIREGGFLRHIARVLTAVCLITGSKSAVAAVITVQPGGAIQTVSEALLRAMPGDTVRVESGTYVESNLRVVKPLTLIGNGWPVVDAGGRGPMFEVTAANVTISGFELRGVPVSFVKEHAAILISETENCEVRDNRFVDNFFAVYLAHSKRCRVLRNSIVGSATELRSVGNGVHMWYCRDIAVQDNQIHGQRDGIYLEFVTHSTISGNDSSDNLRYGLHFMFSDSCRYEKNRFARNGAGVAVMYTSQVDMLENSFEDSWGGASYGLLLKDIRDSRVVGNVISGNSVGIYLEGSDRIVIEGNQFHANGWAIKIMANCVGSKFTANDFIDNSFQVATNSRQSFSEFDGNYWSTYHGYDLDRDGFGDMPYRPVSLYSLIVESEPATMVLIRSLLVDLLNLAERIMPSLTPEALADTKPRMKPAS